MERPVKKETLQTLAPVAEGWQVIREGALIATTPTLDEAMTKLTASVEFTLRLPANCVVLERMTLPATDLTELRGMARLQLEKTIPFPEEEVSSDITVIEKNETETTLLTAAVHHEQLDLLCAPLVSRQLWPQDITVQTVELGKLCPPDATVLMITRELGDVVVAIVEKARLTFAQAVDDADEATLIMELEQMLMGAEMEGVPADFTRIVLAPETADLRGALSKFFQMPVDDLRVADPGMPSLNLLPEPWQVARQKRKNQAQFKRSLMMAGAAYLVLLVAAFAYLVVLDMQTRSLLRKVAVSEPQVTELTQQQSRWQDLAPAVDPHLYTVELLSQIAQCLPSEELRITQFTATPTQIAVQAEAPSANSAIDFGERLKSSPALKGFRFNAEAPKILANNRAQVRIYGKL